VLCCVVLCCITEPINCVLRHKFALQSTARINWWIHAVLVSHIQLGAEFSHLSDRQEVCTIINSILFIIIRFIKQNSETEHNVISKNEYVISFRNICNVNRNIYKLFLPEWFSELLCVYELSEWRCVGSIRVTQDTGQWHNLLLSWVRYQTGNLTPPRWNMTGLSNISDQSIDSFADPC
jgi:hypothetical protein